MQKLYNYIIWLIICFSMLLSNYCECYYDDIPCIVRLKDNKGNNGTIKGKCIANHCKGSRYYAYFVYWFDSLTKIVLNENENNSSSFTYHYIDCYLEDLIILKLHEAFSMYNGKYISNISKRYNFNDKEFVSYEDEDVKVVETFGEHENDYICSLNYIEKDYDWKSNVILNCVINIGKHSKFDNEPLTLEIIIEKDKKEE